MTDPLLTLVAEALISSDGVIVDSKGRAPYRRLAEAALSVIREQEGWRPIEFAPREEFIHTVLVARDHGKRCVVPAFFDGEDWRMLTIAGSLVFAEPTHFRPLPAPPLEKMRCGHEDAKRLSPEGVAIARGAS